MLLQQITQHTVVCSAHFKPEELVKKLSGRVELKDRKTVPSIFHWKPTVNKRRTLKRDKPSTTTISDQQPSTSSMETEPQSE